MKRILINSREPDVKAIHAALAATDGLAISSQELAATAVMGIPIR